MIDIEPIYDSREDFLNAVEKVYLHALEVSEPLRISAFGHWMEDDENLPNIERDEKMCGGLTFGFFTRPPEWERLGSIRTTVPITDVFALGAQLRGRLRRAGKVVSYLEGDECTHVITLGRPHKPEQTWDYGVVASDEEAIRLLFVLDGTTLRKID